MLPSLSLFWGSLSEEVRVCASSGEKQQKRILVDTVDEQPVRLYMAFPEPHEVAGQVMVFVFLREHFTMSQKLHDLIQQVEIVATLRRLFQILLEFV